MTKSIDKTINLGIAMERIEGGSFYRKSVLMGTIKRIPKLIKMERGYGLWEFTVLGKKYRTRNMRYIIMPESEVRKLMGTREWHENDINELLY